MPGERGKPLPFQRSKLSTQFKQKAGWFTALIHNSETPGDGMRVGCPVFSINFNPGNRGKIEPEEIGVETTQSRWGQERGRVGYRLVAKGEAREETHTAGAQPVGGSQSQRRRVATADLKFPDMIVDVVGGAQAKISRQGEGERIPRAECPFAHPSSIRLF